MKARVKDTGEIVEVKSKVVTSFVTRENILKYVDQKTGISYFEEELFFPKGLADDPDYWTRLEHQYAGMVMQSILQTMPGVSEPDKYMKAAIDLSAKIAYALVEKLKEKEERK